MGMFGSGSFDEPQIKYIPPPPSPTSPDPETAAKTQKLLEDAAAVERRVKGRASTILTDVKAMEEEAAKKPKASSQLLSEA